MMRFGIRLACLLSLWTSALVTGCGEADPPSVAPAPVAPPPSAALAPQPAQQAPAPPSAAPPVPAAAAPLPTPFEPSQGQTAHGVYLVRVSSGDDAEARRALSALRERGVTTGSAGELSCDQGAASALHLPEDTVTVSVDFRTHEEATRFAELWGAPVLGVAEFVAFCRD